MLFARQRNEIFELTQHHRAPLPAILVAPVPAKVNSDRLSGNASLLVEIAPILR